LRTTKTTNKHTILPFLETDRLYAAYAIGDMEPDMFRQCTWALALRHGEPQALALHYRGLNPPALFLMGDDEGVEDLLAHELHPKRVYVTCREEHLSTAFQFYHWEEIEPMWRLVVRAEQFLPTSGQCSRLTAADLDELRALYSRGGADAFAPSQLEKGVFYGVRSRGMLLSAAGTHLVSVNYGVAAVGNVFTHPEHRRQGWGRQVTSAVVHDLLVLGIRDVVLNINQENTGAVHTYESLGFIRYCPFVEGRATAARGLCL